MTEDEKKLTKRERDFCRAYVEVGNAREAAVAAGFENNAELCGRQLLCRMEILKEINRLLSRRKALLELKALSGYERLAFGSITDSIRLLFMDKIDREELESMNLFNIAEIKKPKDGAIEIKFFDRLKALEKLSEGYGGRENSAAPFYSALEQSAQALKNEEAIPNEILERS
ncbi:MAG: terminase small subunit [Acutalibacteraceae bacterium]